MFVGLNECMTSSCTCGFPKICIATGASFLHVTIFDFKSCIASGSALVYRTLVVVVGRLLYVPLWSWLQWYFSFSTAFHFEELDVFVGVMEIGLG